MKIIISDIGVFLELQKLNVLAELFALEHDFCISDFVLADIQKEKKIKVEIDLFLRSKSLKICSFKENEVAEILGLRKEFSLNGLSDLSSLYLGIKNKGVFLTCEKMFYDEVLSYGAEAYSLRWVVKELVKNNIIETSSAFSILNRIESIDLDSPFNRIRENIAV